MRVYSIVRLGNKLRYAEVSSAVNARESVCIPSSIPKLLDPYICWKETSEREGFKSIVLQNTAGETWFDLSSNIPLEKMFG